ncbi:hypothetical protein ACTA71_006024 [Dictyostelium dimigraforme]
MALLVLFKEVCIICEAHLINLEINNFSPTYKILAAQSWQNSITPNTQWNNDIMFIRRNADGAWPGVNRFDGNGVYFVFGNMAPHGLTLLYIGKASHRDGRGLFHRGFTDLTDDPRFWGTPNANPPEMANAEVLMYYRGFDGPVAGHAEWWFLSVFGCPQNSFNEGGLKTSVHGYGAGQWNFFHATAPAVNVRQYIINQVPSPGLFFRLPNYPSAPSILRRIVNCEAEREALVNQVANLQNQVAQFQNQVVNLQNANELLTNFNGYLAAALLNAMPQIPNLNAFLQVYGAGLSVSSEAIHNWNEARKNGGGGIGGIGGIGGVDGGKKGDGKKGSDGADGADGADDGWLKSGCVCPEAPPCPVVVPCPEPVVCNMVEIQTQLNSTIASLDECQKLKNQSNIDLDICLVHKTETQKSLSGCQKEYQKIISGKDGTQISLTNCQKEYEKEIRNRDPQTDLKKCQREYDIETGKKDKLCRGLSRHIIGITDFCEEQVEKLRLANCD